MRCSRLLAVAAAAVLAFAAPAAAQDSICAKYANVLTVPQVDLMTALINRVIFGVNNQTSTFGSRGTFVGLRSDANTLDVVSTTNFGASSGSISLTGANGNVIGLARRPNGGNFSFIDTNGQTYTADVDSAIRSGVSTVVLVAQTGAGVAARATGGNIGFDFNPVGDALRITNGNNNFRLNANTGAAGAGATADGTDSGNPFSYDPATAPAGAATPLIVATAYTNQVSPSPRNATITFGTTQYGIDQANKRFVTISVPNAGTIGASNPITVNGNAIPDFTSADITTVPSSGATPPSNTVVATINGILYTINPSSGVATPLGGALNGTSYRSVAFTPAVGNNGIIEPLNAVAGIAGSPNIVGFFNTVRKFKTNQPDWTVPGDAQNTLRSKLVAFFGQAGALGCNAAGFPQYSSSQSQYSIHAAMNITQAEFDTFNLQVATAASSFGVSTTDVDSVRSVLSGFGRQPTTGNSNAICTDSGCACAPGFDSANNCQSTSSSSSGGNGTPTNPDNGAAAGLSAPFALVAALALAMAALRA